ncbi:gamma-glutamyl-gamma-aminobutyrate hydrolase family protein [Kitasatospora sp. RG8]|uniref:gamma-glutamyl-gamma-aminobutyrate hydrolase family protein n=1 Tax=Kitasatospora sp. RG8 TaxID=2820815 RepID=UPI0027DEA816|nr:gamma-glutamyl-gamma-aminobutyrate hydrolase family protein [Kitasatospora sp. RG8]
MGARTADGTVEAVESTRHRFAVGVQWHSRTGFDAAAVHARPAAARPPRTLVRTAPSSARRARDEARRESPCRRRCLDTAVPQPPGSGP